VCIAGFAEFVFFNLSAFYCLFRQSAAPLSASPAARNYARRRIHPESTHFSALPARRETSFHHCSCCDKQLIFPFLYCSVAWWHSREMRLPCCTEQVLVIEQHGSVSVVRAFIDMATQWIIILHRRVTTAVSYNYTHAVHVVYKWRFVHENITQTAAVSTPACHKNCRPIHLQMYRPTVLMNV